jgi:hypothetical protein
MPKPRTPFARLRHRGIPPTVIQILPGHGWADVIGLVLIFAVAILGFLVGLAVLISRSDPNADGIAEHWP